MSAVYSTRNLAVAFVLFLGAGVPVAVADHPSLAESPALYGLHDHGFDYLERILPAGSAWVTATSGLGADPDNHAGEHFDSYEEGLPDLTVIGRLNYGYFPEGTIPPRDQWLDFAQRCANFVANSSGCGIWVIGNETNLAAEWPLENGRFNYVSPEDYAVLYRLVYNAIKSVKPDHKVLPQAIAPWAGPYGAGTFGDWPHDGMPINWVQYKHRMLTAIAATGPVDGIAAHINSRGYSYDDIHSAHRIDAGGQSLSFSFGVYRDWVDFGIPRSLYHLPIYATEANGNYYWKGGHPEAPEETYEPGWMQEVYAEVDRYNQDAAETGRPIYRSINMYRWCGNCDGWNIDGDNPFREQILDDLYEAAVENYRWPEQVAPASAPPAPDGLAAVAADGRVELGWEHPEPVSQYRIYRDMDPGGEFQLIAEGIHEAVYFDTTVVPGTEYFYRVAAVNAGGESELTSPVSASPTEARPDLIVTSLGWDPYDPVEEEPIVFRVRVKNVGGAPTPPGVIIGVGFEVIGHGTMTWHGSHTSSIEPGQSLVLAADGGLEGGAWTGESGRYTVVATANDVNRFTEGNQDNNSRVATFDLHSPRRLAINSGGSPVETFDADAHFSEGSAASEAPRDVSVSGVPDPAPAEVYDTARLGHFTYTMPGLMPRALHRVRLHFTEPSAESPGGRVFDVAINGRLVLEDFDIRERAGAVDRAVLEEFFAPADSRGVIRIEYTPSAGEALSSGIEVLFASIPPQSLQSPEVEVVTDEGATALTLTWETEPGRTYLVQSAGDLTDGWVDLSEPLVATGATLAYELPVTVSDAGFYRIVLEQD